MNIETSLGAKQREELFEQMRPYWLAQLSRMAFFETAWNKRLLQGYLSEHKAILYGGQPLPAYLGRHHIQEYQRRKNEKSDPQ